MIGLNKHVDFYERVPPRTVIARREATHPRVASLAPAGQFTFWQSAINKVLHLA